MKRWAPVAVLVAFLAAAGLFALLSDTNEAFVEATRAAVITEVYNPVTAGEPTPADFRQLLRRDSIRPIYDPQFVPASESAWTETTIVIGVEVNGDARAYSVAHLGRREMVNDVIGGEPLLVTW